MHVTRRATARPRPRLVVAAALVLALLTGWGTRPAGGQASAPAAATLAATPSSDLLDQQLVTVSGSGFTPGALVVIVQCLDGAGIAGCDLSRQTFASADASGAFSSGFQVSRLMYVDGTTDCAEPGACVIGAGVPPDGALGNATVPIRFDPSAPLPPPPAIQVAPSTGLADRQVVTITGQGFPPGAGVFFVQCLAGAAGQDACDLGNQAFGVVDGAGTFTTTMRVARILVTPSGSADCADPGTCVIGGGVPPDGSAGSATAPIAFAAGTPAPAPDPAAGPDEGSDPADASPRSGATVPRFTG